MKHNTMLSFGSKECVKNFSIRSDPDPHFLEFLLNNSKYGHFFTQRDLQNKIAQYGCLSQTYATSAKIFYFLSFLLFIYQIRLLLYTGFYSKVNILEGIYKQGNITN